MKKLLTLTLTFLLTLSIFGSWKENRKITDEQVTDWVLSQLEGMGYTILPEVVIQDTLKHKKQNFSSKYETKGGRGYLLPDWANDSTWSPGSKPPKDKSNYEKYWESKNGVVEQQKPEPKPEFDDLYYQPSKDQKKVKYHKKSDVDIIVDTLVSINPNIEVNTYYVDRDPFYYSYSRFFRPYFIYNPYYGYSPYYNYFYDDMYFGWNYNYMFGWDPFWDYRFGYPYYGYGYGFGFGWHNSFYFGWNSWNWHNHYNQGYNHYSYNGGAYNSPNYSRRESPSTYTRHQIDNTGNRNRIDSQQKRTTQGNINQKPSYGENRRTYQPSYENPRMSTRPTFNNSRTNSDRSYNNIQNSSQTRRTENIGQRNYTPSQRNTYSTPSQSRTYNSTPSRNYGGESRRSESFSGGSSFRSSNSSNMGNSSASGGSSRSSSGSSNNSGGGSGRR